MAKILCISDIHFSESTDLYVYGDKINENFSRSISASKLDILFSAMEEIGPVDLIIFCGDYIIGKNSESEKRESINSFLSFLNRVENSPKIFKAEISHPCDRILIVPGNHDINRGENNILEDFINKLNKYLTPFENKGRRQEFPPLFIFDDLKLIVACESTVENSSTKNTEMEDVLLSVDKLSGDNNIKEKIKNVLNNYSLFDIPSITENSRKNFIDTNNIIGNNEKYDKYVKIVVSHHPLLDGIETTNTIKKYKGTIGGYSFMRCAINFGYRLFIHGHIHESSCIEIVDHNLDLKNPIIQLGVPMVEVDSDNYGAILIDTDVANDYAFPFTSVFLRLDSISRKFKHTRAMISNKREKEIYRGDRILIDKDISQLIRDNIIVKNGDLSNVEAASYDCALGYEFKRGNAKCCNWGEIKVESLSASSDSPSAIELKPKETILIFTYESFDIPNDMVLHASPISSWLRKGIRVDLSYLVDPGFKGKFSFPITNESDQTVYINSREPIVSVEFIKLSCACERSWSSRHEERVRARLNLDE